ncbi:MAG: hypothetical protein IIA60_02660, partial [Candidatus Marinimicrobia bacterium]|nr:hypothetical protein [Candidatus Neomarinimicrobiota bacterium]
DCNADGIGDFLISAPMNDFAGEDAGRVYLYSGIDGALLNTFEGAPGETLGREIDGGMDLNSDGIPDFIAGAPSGGLNFGTPGVIYAFSSQNKTPLYSFMTTSPDSTLGLGLGVALSFAGDLDNDGVSDIIAGVPGFKALFGEELYPIGSVEIRSGVDGSVISVINAPVEMDFAGGGFGSRVAGGGDVNGDGSPSNNDLIYIPSDQSEINLADYTDSDGNVVTAAAQWTALNAFIEQDNYLSAHRGEIAERFGAVNPWYSNLDLRILQDISAPVTGNLQISLDVLNVANLLNSKWGVRKVATVAATSPIKLVEFNDAGAPVFNFTGPAETYIDDPGLFSRWQIQLGLRYSF